ncbi:DegT/DnrJ/EryC1/StrS family aminotransferase [Blastococcus sp. TML/M2B]|uniref:DegT/DnrJ/EryC1/StrS family aminotransferase n=1 Tax=unclassified Blastococcus TaxID=2619396 RepID=UPI00190D63FF|nr:MULTISPECIES: DegT/DnrJ/EryC1/StrS family aminotransferase [unclassified Blastococcus]MBN1091273.1 DegT/DnrJ/EryC1/StrS family aminotransferase [Blastococcus sp. TML/M2B]MBN1095170.1 DegT/DnrJ/EryC1/StrS family aminotransferase [Blastococcus sp. TML/C7B]
MSVAGEKPRAARALHLAAVPAPVPFLDLPAGAALVREELDRHWERVLAHGRFVGGPEVTVFEQEFAYYCARTGCVGVANGTDALELILQALGIGRGDEVVVPANTFVATAEAVCAVGARPRFVDVDPGTLEVDPDAVAAAVGPRTAAVMAVHLFGQMADVDRLVRIAERHGLALIEDAAQAHGARFGGRPAGSVGTAAAFSFYPGKNLGALGDGGAVVSNDAALLGRIRQLANHGRSDGGRHLHELRGRNSRLDSLQGAALSVRLARLDADNERRRAAWRRYRDRLPEGLLLEQHPRAESVHHLAVVQVADRPAVTAALDDAGIGWGLHYPVPCHLQPAFAEFADGPLPVAERAAGRILSLPMFPTMSVAQVDRVCDVLSGVGDLAAVPGGVR